MTIEKYVLENTDGHQHDGIYDTVDEAREAATSYDAVAIIALQFEYEDSELVEVWRNGHKTSEKAWPA